MRLFACVVLEGEVLIPHIIHYCWFGNNPFSEKEIKCIESWKKFCPDYEIKLWNEDNFDLDCCDYVREAYAAKKWAFVSDYARFWILYNYGGVYFDTDVEIIKSIDQIVERGAFMGTEPGGGIAPGLGIGAERGMNLYRDILDFYATIHFLLPDGSLNEQTVVKYTTEVFKSRGWSFSSELKKVDGIWIYPSDVFCPIDNRTGKTHFTENTVSIHNYSASWHTKLDDIVYKIERCGESSGFEYRFKRVLSFPFRVINKYKKLGFKNTMNFIRMKLSNKM